MVANLFRLPCALCALSWLSACAPMIALVGYGGPTMQLAAQVDRIKLASDGVSYLESGKTITDHAVSMVVGADCRLFNVMSSQPVCRTEQETTADNADSQAQHAATDDDLTGDDAVATTALPYAMDGKLIAGYRAGPDDTTADP